MPGDNELGGAGAPADPMIALVELLAQRLAAVTTNAQAQNHPFFQLWEKEPLRGGPEEDVQRFFENFEHLASLVDGVTDQMKLVELCKCLRDRALLIYQSASAAQKASYASLKEYLCEALPLPHQRSVYRQSLHMRKKLENESVADYYRALRRLADQAYPNESIEARNLMVKERFIAGLEVTSRQDPRFKLWKAAFTRAHMRLEDVVAAAQAEEVALKTVSLVPDIATNLTNDQALAAFQNLTAILGGGSGQTNAVGGAQPQQAARAASRRSPTPERRRRDVDDRRHERNYRGGRDRNSESRRPQGRSRPRESRECHFCHRTGHLRYDCWMNPDGHNYRPDYAENRNTRARRGEGRSRSRQRDARPRSQIGAVINRRQDERRRGEDTLIASEPGEKLGQGAETKDEPNGEAKDGPHDVNAHKEDDEWSIPTTPGKDIVLSEEESPVKENESAGHRNYLRAKRNLVPAGGTKKGKTSRAGKESKEEAE